MLIKVGEDFVEKGKPHTRYECVEVKDDGTILGCNYEDGFDDKKFEFFQDEIEVLDEKYY